MGRKPRVYPTWQEAARDLNKLDPKKYNQPALARIFSKNVGTIWWEVLHSDWGKEYKHERYLRRREQTLARDKERYQLQKHDPDYKARIARNNRAYRQRQKQMYDEGTHPSVLYANFGDD